MTTATDNHLDRRSLEEQFTQRFQGWAQRVRLTGKLAIVIAVAAGVFGVATYAVWSGSGPIGPSPRTVLILLVADLILLLSLGALIARHLVRLWVERRSGSAGSRLHTRFVGLFSLVAVAPAIVTAVFSALFFYLGIQSWFSERVRTAVQESLAVAEAYIDEHRQTIRADVLAMANDLNREAIRLARNPARFNNFLEAQAALRALSEATVFDSSGRILARTSLSLAAAFETVPVDQIERAAGGQVVVFSDEDVDVVRALVQLDRFLDAYLYVGRFVEPQVVNHVERVRDVVAEYEALEGARSNIQLTSALIFIVVAVMLLLVAVWLGLIFANQLVRPIGALVMAAERVRQGDLTAHVAEGAHDDEFGTLSRAFNRMTAQLEAQRGELVEANRQLDRRRRFTEAVLSGVSAGVIGLDRDGRIHLPNRSAAELLETDIERLAGQPFDQAVPEMAALLAEARARPDRVAEAQVTIDRKGHRRTLIVRVSGDRGHGNRQGFVVTFDDVSALLTAQRAAAWADVARRIAHEIKNPLTPIQLSAERLKRKYLKEITTDPDVFSQCTDTIVRQVGDIGRMVDEFSAFARMPAPVMKTENLVSLAKQSIFPQRMSHPDIAYVQDLPEQPVPIRCDSRQVAQVLTNVLKNAAEAIEGRPVPDGGTLPPGRIAVAIRTSPGRVLLTVSDNGRGLPATDRDRLTEPYVTTRAKGTGLGLAIVKKIMEDHGGSLALEDNDDGEGGARIRLEFNAVAEAGERGEAEAPPTRATSYGA